MATWGKSPDKSSPPSGTLPGSKPSKGPWVFMLLTPGRVIAMDAEANAAALDPSQAIAQAGEGALVLDASKVDRENAKQIADFAPSPDPRIPVGKIKRYLHDFDSIPDEIKSKLPPGVNAENCIITSNRDLVNPETWASFWIESFSEARTGHVHNGIIVWDDASLRPTQAQARA